MIKFVIGILLIIIGIVLGIYLGLWIMLVGGIVQVIQSTTPIVKPLGIAFGIVRIMFASFIGWLTFHVCSAIGLAFLSND